MADSASSRSLPEFAPLPGSRDYEHWLSEQGRPDDGYLFSDPRARFEVRDDDRLVKAPGLHVEHDAGELAFSIAGRPPTLHLPGVDSRRCLHFLELCDGERSLATAAREAGLGQDDRARLLKLAFGRILFAPSAVAELEASVSGTELVRFPGSPYELDRNYWANMIDVRSAWPALEAKLADVPAALGALVALHGLALMGKSGQSYYRPASPISAKGVHPGLLWQAETRLAEAGGVVRFLSGPRVNASLLGGEHYAALVAECSGDPEAVSARRDHIDARGLGWGRVVTAQAEHDPAPAPWFCPPRPLTLGHFESLFSSLATAIERAAANDAEATVGALACFHQKFVRLHPFRAANQSLAMSLTNAVLARVIGGGIPHLILDQLALRFSEAAYRRLFDLAVRGYSVSGSALERHRKLVERKQRCFTLIEQLKDATDLDQARLAALSHAEDARLALIDV